MSREFVVIIIAMVMIILFGVVLECNRSSSFTRECLKYHSPLECKQAIK